MGAPSSSRTVPRGTVAAINSYLEKGSDEKKVKKRSPRARSKTMKLKLNRLFL